MSQLNALRVENKKLRERIENLVEKNENQAKTIKELFKELEGHCEACAATLFISIMKGLYDE